MPFDQATFSPVGPTSTASPNLYSYSTSDDILTVTSSGYFLAKKFQLEKDDVIFVAASDGAYQVVVSTDTATAIIGTPVDGGPLNLSNTVLVNELADLPTPVGGVIQLADNTAYIFAPGVALGTNRITDGEGNAILSFNVNHAPVTYTGSSPMFTVTGSLFSIENFNLDCPNATVFDVSGSGIFNANTLFIGSCQALASINQKAHQLRNINVQSCASGVSISGTNILVSSIDRIGFISSTGTLIDFGTSTILEMEISNCLFNTSGIAISGLPNSGNLAANSVGEISLCNFNGATTPLSGIQINDIRFDFLKNSGISDSTYIADSYLSISRTVPIGTIGLFEPIDGGNWVSDITARFTSDSNGEIVYAGEKQINILVIATATVEKVGGGSDTICMRIAVDSGGGYVTQQKTESCTRNTTPTTVISQGVFQINQGTKIKLYVANADSTADVIVNLADISVINGF